MKNLLLLIFWSLGTAVQTENAWDLLASAQVTTIKDPIFGGSIDRPIFSEALKQREGQSITLEGFIIPLQQEQDQDFFVLSRFPYQNCFFCGGAGPETVVEVYTERGHRYTDKKVQITGKLSLNPNDPLHLFYIVREARVLTAD